MGKIKQTVSGLMELIKEAEDHRDQYLLKTIKDNLNHLKGEYLKTQDDAKVKYTVNLAHSVSNTIITAIYSRVPEFAIDINRFHDELKASKGLGNPVEVYLLRDKVASWLEQVVKRLYISINADETNREAIYDAIWAGYGVTKTGYKHVTDKKKEKAIRDNGCSPSELEASEIIKNNQPFVIRVNPTFLLYDPNAPRIDRSSWYCEEIYVNKEDVKEYYGIDVTEEMVLTGDKNSMLSQDFLKDKVKLYEFHLLDEEDPRIYVFNEHIDTFLVDKQHPLFNKETGKVKNVYQFIWFNTNPVGCFPIADLTLIQNQLYEANTFMNKRVEAIKKMVGFYALTGNWSQDNIKRMKGMGWGGVLDSIEAGASVTPVIPIPLGAEYWENIANIQNEMYTVLGLTDYAIGGQTQKRKATEAMIIDRAMSNRVNVRITAIQSFIFSQIDTILEWIKVSQVKPVKYTSKFKDEFITMELGKEFLQYTDIEVSVVQGSTAPMDMDSQRRRAESLVLIAQSMGDLMNRTEVAREAISTIGYRDVDRFLMQQQASPMPAQTQQMPGQQNTMGELTRSTQMNGEGAV